MSITQAQVDDLRERLSDVDTTTAPDATLERCLQVAEGMVAPLVPTYNRGEFGYLEAVACLGVRVYEERARGRVGVDPAGEFDVTYTPGPTKGMVDSVAGYWLPLTETGTAVIA